MSCRVAIKNGSIVLVEEESLTFHLGQGCSVVMVQWALTVLMKPLLFENALEAGWRVEGAKVTEEWVPDMEYVEARREQSPYHTEVLYAVDDCGYIHDRRNDTYFYVL